MSGDVVHLLPWRGICSTQWEWRGSLDFGSATWDAKDVTCPNCMAIVVAERRAVHLDMNGSSITQDLP
jgi:hypothetical protein